MAEEPKRLNSEVLTAASLTSLLKLAPADSKVNDRGQGKVGIAFDGHAD